MTSILKCQNIKAEMIEFWNKVSSPHIVHIWLTLPNIEGCIGPSKTRIVVHLADSSFNVNPFTGYLLGMEDIFWWHPVILANKCRNFHNASNLLSGNLRQQARLLLCCEASSKKKEKKRKEKKNRFFQWALCQKCLQYVAVKWILSDLMGCRLWGFWQCSYSCSVSKIETTTGEMRAFHTGFQKRQLAILHWDTSPSQILASYFYGFFRWANAQTLKSKIHKVDPRDACSMQSSLWHTKEHSQISFKGFRT